MLEPDVTLTDYLLTVECLTLAGLLWRAQVANIVTRRALIVFFLSLAVGAGLGGTSHGFFPYDAGAVGVALWGLTLVFLGIAAWGGWTVFAWSSFAPRPARVVTAVSGAILLGYIYYVAVIDQAYSVVILHYVPAILALTFAFFARALQSGHRMAWVGLTGLILTFVAAGVQLAGFGLHPRYFNHNAMYHVIQFVALLLFYKGGRWLCDQPVLYGRAARAEGV